MNSQKAYTKIGKLEHEISKVSKILFLIMLTIAFSITAMGGFFGEWGLKFFKFVIMFSYLIPLSLRTNLEIAKACYSFSIAKDKNIPGTIPRNSTIPEELGRI
jgi:phospholipid-translocating ATPase